MANLSSFVLDFAARQKIGGLNLNFFIVKQFPVLPPSTYNTELLALIVPRVLELTYTADNLGSFAHACGYSGPPFVWDEERRAQLRAKLDGLYAHLYGLSRDDFAYILDTFPIVRRRDEAALGEYRTARLCLEAYDYFAPETLLSLDRDVKRIEVALRALIDRELGPSASSLPPNLHEKLTQRREQHGGASLATVTETPPLATLLETCYLIDLQKIIANPACWPRFQARFESKSILEHHFTRLNELRNPLAHSRSMPEQTRREGEAAVAWFKQRLELG